jgi:predicted ATPase
LEERFPETPETQPELLAYHFTEAGLHEQAVGYWQQAGQKAIQRSANVEAIALLSQGLEQLRTLPDTSERALQELTFQRTLGVPLMATKGFATPEVERAYARARELCERVGDTSQLGPVLFGLWGLYEVRGDLQTAREVAEQLLTLAQHKNDSALILQGHRALGDTLWWLGAFASARAHLERGIALYDPQQHHSHAFLYGQDPGMGCLTYAALTLWCLGYPDQALQRGHEALTLMQGLSHPFSQAFALNMAARLSSLRREWQVVQERNEELMALSTAHGFAQMVTSGMRVRGLVLFMNGQEEEGLANMRQGMDAYQAIGAVLTRIPSLALLGEAYGKRGQPEEGLCILVEALTLVEKIGMYYCEAELHRLKGELLLQQSSDNYTEAESCFHQAIAVAQNQSAKSWELRAATSLAKLWQRQDKQQEAYDLLAPVYNWFTEGFDTADLKDAKALLDELR